MKIKTRYLPIVSWARISDDNICIVEGCENKLHGWKAYCKKHKEERSEYFKKIWKENNTLQCDDKEF